MQKIVRKRNQTLVMVTHDNYLAGFADRIIHIMDGKIVKVEENHNPQGILANGGGVSQGAAGTQSGSDTQGGISDADKQTGSPPDTAG